MSGKLESGRGGMVSNRVPVGGVDVKLRPPGRVGAAAVVVELAGTNKRLLLVELLIAALKC